MDHSILSYLFFVILATAQAAPQNALNPVGHGQVPYFNKMKNNIQNSDEINIVYPMSYITNNEDKVINRNNLKSNTNIRQYPDVATLENEIKNLPFVQRRLLDANDAKRRLLFNDNPLQKNINNLLTKVQNLPFFQRQLSGRADNADNEIQDVPVIQRRLNDIPEQSSVAQVPSRRNIDFSNPVKSFMDTLTQGVQSFRKQLSPIADIFSEKGTNSSNDKTEPSNQNTRRNLDSGSEMDGISGRRGIFDMISRGASEKETEVNNEDDTPNEYISDFRKMREVRFQPGYKPLPSVSQFEIGGIPMPENMIPLPTQHVPVQFPKITIPLPQPEITPGQPGQPGLSPTWPSWPTQQPSPWPTQPPALWPTLPPSPPTQPPSPPTHQPTVIMPSPTTILGEVPGLPQLLDPIWKIINNLLPFIGKLGGTIFPMIPDLVTFVGHAIECIKRLMPFITNVFRSIIQLFPSIEKIVQFFKKMIYNLPEAIRDLYVYLSDIAHTIGNIIKHIIGFLDRISYRIRRLLMAPCGILVELFSSVFYFIAALITEPFKAIRCLIHGIWQLIIAPPLRDLRNLLYRIVKTFIVEPIYILRSLIGGIVRNVFVYPVQFIRKTLHDIFGPLPQESMYFIPKQVLNFAQSAAYASPQFIGY